MVVVIGLFIGLVLGLTGAGGSIFAVPLLVLLLDLPLTQAMGLALGAVAASAIYGTWMSRKQVLWLPASILALGGMLTAPLGKWAALYINEWVLSIGFSGVAIVIGVGLWRQASNTVEQSQLVRANVAHVTPEEKQFACRLSPNGQFQLKPRCLSGLIMFGLLIGFASGLLGVGGGFLIIPTLIFLSQIAMAKAIGTSLLIISLISTSGFVAHIQLSGIDNPSMLIGIIAMSFVGMFVSHFIANKIAGRVLQKIFSVLLLLVAILMVSTKLLEV